MNFLNRAKQSFKMQLFYHLNIKYFYVDYNGLKLVLDLQSITLNRCMRIKRFIMFRNALFVSQKTLRLTFDWHLEGNGYNKSSYLMFEKKTISGQKDRL